MKHGRPEICFIRSETDELMYYRDAEPDEEGWRRQHALASLRACLSVLAFAAVAEERDRQMFDALRKGLL
jgi:hypothetical protein